MTAAESGLQGLVQIKSQFKSVLAGYLKDYLVASYRVRCHANSA